MNDIDIENGITTLQGTLDEDGYLNVLWKMTDEEIKGVVEGRVIEFRIPISPKPNIKTVELYFEQPKNKMKQKFSEAAKRRNEARN